ncbi:MAG: hypothetical protein JWM85_3424 [Acidimicrobiaceae bacterium]|nr:hypothetical protein [Acidimicrobiaceae bacterium]
MLTLTRSVGERILIGDDIIIEVRAVLDGKQVRISIDAPRQVPIHRAEVFEAVSRENLAAINASESPDALANSIRAARRAAAGARPEARPAPEAGGPEKA